MLRVALLSRLTSCARLAPAAALALLLAPEARAQQVYLLQASGYMEPFYSTEKEKFFDKIERLMKVTQEPRWPVTVATFNRHGTVQNECSPRTIFPAISCEERAINAPWDVAKASAAVRSVYPPKKTNRESLADTYLHEALLRARAIYLEGNGGLGEGVIWMVTNNKNAFEGIMTSDEIRKHSLDFYRELKRQPAITAAVAVPVKMPARGSGRYAAFSERGFIIYGIAYGASGRQLLDYVSSKDEFTREVGAPFRIRPLDRDPLRLMIEKQTVADNVVVVMAPDGAIVMQGVQIGSATQLAFTGSLVNTLHPQRIVSAALSANWKPGPGSRLGEIQVRVEPSEITNLGPRQKRDGIRVSIDFTAVKAPEDSTFRQQLFSEEGYLNLVLNRLQLENDETALRAFEDVFAGEALGPGQAQGLPREVLDMFVQDTRLGRAEGDVVIRFTGKVTPWGTIAWIGAAILALLLLGGAGLLLATPRRQFAMVDGMRTPITLKPFRSAFITGPTGRRYRVRSSLFGKNATVRPESSSSV